MVLPEKPRPAPTVWRAPTIAAGSLKRVSMTKRFGSRRRAASFCVTGSPETRRPSSAAMGSEWAGGTARWLPLKAPGRFSCRGGVYPRKTYLTLRGLDLNPIYSRCAVMIVA
jgi:hypothetical protein